WWTRGGGGAGTGPPATPSPRSRGRTAARVASRRGGPRRGRARTWAGSRCAAPPREVTDPPLTRSEPERAASRRRVPRAAAGGRLGGGGRSGGEQQPTRG